MEQELKALYNKLAKQIMSMIPVRWEVFHYLGEVEPGKASYSSVFYFRDAESGEFIQSNTIPKQYNRPESTYMAQWVELNKIMLEVFDCFEAHGQAPWEQMSLSVERTGKFKINYNYDVMTDKDGGQLVRELIWARDTFGYEPEEGSPERKVLDRYLNNL